MDLEGEFHSAMIGVYEQARSFGYNPTRFLQMVYELGGVQAAKSLLGKPGVQDGLISLWQHGRLDISMEALVLQDRFRQLFTERELQEAHRRLEELGYFKASRR